MVIINARVFLHIPMAKFCRLATPIASPIAMVFIRVDCELHFVMRSPWAFQKFGAQEMTNGFVGIVPAIACGEKGEDVIARRVIVQMQ